MSLEKVEIATISHEQLKEINALETRLGVTLVAYEGSAGSTLSD